jgi:hypothetical protein
MPPKKKKKQQKKKQILTTVPKHPLLGIKKYLQKNKNIKGPKFYPGVYEEFNETPTPQVPTEEELKKEELRNKLNLRYTEISRKNAEINNKYKNFKRNRPEHIFIPKDKRGWHEEYNKAIKNETYQGSYNDFKKDRLTFHRKSSVFPKLHRLHGVEFRNAEDSNSDYDLNYSEGNLDEDINVNNVLDKNIFLQPPVSRPRSKLTQQQQDNLFMFNEDEPRSQITTKQFDENNSNRLDTWDRLIDDEISFFNENLNDDNNNLNQSVDANNNLNEDINNIIDDIYFEPEVSEPYTKRSEKQYDEDDNRLRHSSNPNDLIELEDSLHDIVRISPSEFVRNQRNFYANNVNNLDNGLLKPPNFNKNINNNLLKPPNHNFRVNNNFIKPRINTPYNRLLHPPISPYSLAPRLPSIHNNVNNNNEAINETINENIHINDNTDFTIHEVDDNEDEHEPPNPS